MWISMTSIDDRLTVATNFPVAYYLQWELKEILYFSSKCIMYFS